MRSVADRGVDAFRVVVRDVVSKQPCQVVFAQHDHVIEKLATNRSHEAFRCPVLPGTLKCRSLGMDSESRDRAGDLSREDRVVVEDEKPMPRVIGEGLSQLAGSPTQPMDGGSR